MQAILSWLASANPTPTGYNIRVSDGSATVGFSTAETSTLYSLPANFNANVLWTYTVTPTTDIAIGPVGTGYVVPSAVAVSLLSCLQAGNGTEGTLAITAASSSFSSYLATLTCFGRTVLTQS